MAKHWMRIGRITTAALFMVIAGLAFSGFGGAIASLLQVQFGPALMKCVAAFSIGTLSILLGIAVFTFLFGRFYCSILCPFGILQDVIGCWRQSSVVPNFRKTRYAIAGAVLGLLFCGWSGGFLLLDPYSNFGRIFASFTVGGLIPLFVIATLAIWKKRIYCTAICPVGTLLGLFAKYGVFKLAIIDKCVKCGKCGKVCPTGCIDPATGTIDNERCIRCMNCVAVCPLGCIGFAGLKMAEVPVNASRRAFLVNGGIFVAGIAAGAVLAKTGLEKLGEIARRFKILPPGAGDAERFAAKCTACQLCSANCPTKIIVPAPGGDGPVSLDLSKGLCLFDCIRCSQVCPTGAIRPLTLAVKQRTKIAEAEFNPKVCIVFQEGEKCGRCAEACPVHAISLRKNGTPRPVAAALCIGCGACQSVCPATPQKAMTVHEIEKQLQLES